LKHQQIRHSLFLCPYYVRTFAIYVCARALAAGELARQFRSVKDQAERFQCQNGGIPPFEFALIFPYSDKII
jgi:hypothetical protein